MGAALLGAVFAVVAASPARSNEEAAAAHQTVQDLHYGDVLFHFYQGDYFAALVRLQGARHFERLAHHETDAALLEGGLDLSLGQHEEAGRIFRRVLDGAAPPAVRDRAWFYLAKVWFQRDYLDRSTEALAAIGDALPAEFEPERRLLEAQVRIELGDYDAAIRVLDGWQTSPAWSAYGRFNLGVALIRAGRLDDAAQQLDAVGQMAATSEELAALRDKANLALGFAWINAGRADDARAVLDRVRLEGPLSNKALLGAGWADSEAGRYRRALVPWLELKERSLLDAAVQESYLAIPYAYAQLAADARAADHYSLAITAYADESMRIDESIARIRAGDWIETVLAHDEEGRAGWYWQLKELPDAPETRYLHHLLATHGFQEGLKNYRDLDLLTRNLADWTQSLEAFDDMIEARERAAREREAVYSRVMQAVDLDALRARATAVEARIQTAEANEDVAALATSTERERWARIAAIQARLDAIADRDPRIAAMSEKARLIRGTIYWEMQGAFKARLWRERKSVRELEVALRDAQRRRLLVERARAETPAATGDFALRVATIAPRIERLSAQLAQARHRQSEYLAGIAIAELESQQARLATYSRQAEFALATIYDRASTATTAEGAR
jgi:hypothetical protein